MSKRNWVALVALLLGSGALFMARAQTERRDQPPPPDNRGRPGEPPPGGFGPPGFGGPGGFGQDRKLVHEYDKDGDGRLNKDERQAARDALKKERAAGGGRGGFGGRGPGGRGMGPDFAASLLKAIDADKDGKATRAELAAGVKLFFEGAIKEKQDSLDEQQLAEALNRLFPRPPGGPGGGPPGGPGVGGPPPGGPGAGGPPPGGPGAGGPGGGMRFFGPGMLFAGTVIKRADADKNGKVTLDELKTAADALLKETDKDKDGKLDETETGASIALLMSAPGGFGPGFGRENREPGKPGPRVSPADVKAYPKADLYEPTVLRTLFLEFENKDWETELSDFHGTDVEVPATLTVDGKAYPNVGIHFRGMSSYGMVPAGSKRSMNVSVDFADPKQRLYGYKTLNLLNAHEDSSFLHTVLYSQVAREFIPAPKANLVKVVVNGESWGVYTNAQQFDKVFATENFSSSKGARWKVRGSPGGRGGLEDLGDNLDEYKRRYEIKTDDDAKSWKALVALCKTLNKTPPDKLEAALKPILDVDGALWFLALENVLINSDGYWIRASDYSICLDGKGRFHIVPHDMNEVFRPGGGPGFGGPPGGRPGGPGGPAGLGGGPGGRPGGPGMGPRGNGLEIDPLIGLDDATKPLRSRLLAVPSLKARYLAHVRTIAERWLDWKNLGPVVAQYRALIEKEIEADTRKLSSFAAFKEATADEATAEPAPGPGRPGGITLRDFAAQRQKFLLNHPEVKKATP